MKKTTKDLGACPSSAHIESIFIPDRVTSPSSAHIESIFIPDRVTSPSSAHIESIFIPDRVTTNVRCAADPTDKVRQHLRELERLVVALPADTKDRQVAASRIRSMVGDQLAELTWWRPEAK